MEAHSPDPPTKRNQHELEAMDRSIDRSHIGKIERGEFVPELYTCTRSLHFWNKTLQPSLFVKDNVKKGGLLQ